MGVLWLLSVAMICHSGQQWRGVVMASSTPAPVVPRNATLPATSNVTGDPKAEVRLKRGTFDTEDKRAAKLKFSSWAGKRADDSSDSGENSKRGAKFSSWAGKRADEDGYPDGLYPGDDSQSGAFYLGDASKRGAKFSSWAGKRAEDPEGYLSYEYQGENPKRGAKFSSWAGKRAEDGDLLDGFGEETVEEKRGKFNSWAGKRTVTDSGGFDDKRAKFSSWAGKRGKFNSWAGKRSGGDNIDMGEGLGSDDVQALGEFKRSPDYVGSRWGKASPENRLKYYAGNGGGSENVVKLWQDLMSRKRARFSSWAGKRSSDDAEKRARFSSWGGKRAEDEATALKRGGGSFSWPAFKRKPIFSSWGGKRTSEHTILPRSVAPNQSRTYKTRPWGTLMRPVRKQPEFYAWGGKRAV